MGLCLMYSVGSGEAPVGKWLNKLLLISGNQTYKVDRNFKHKKNFNCSAYVGTNCNSKYRILTALMLLFRMYEIMQ